MNLSFTVTGDKEIQRAIMELARKNAVKVKAVTRKYGENIKKTAQQNLSAMKIDDTGNLAGSIRTILEDGGFKVIVKVGAAYGIYVEYGARPHFPPPDALEAWASRHGFDSAWPICVAIAEHGIPERPFLGPAYMKEKDKYIAALRKIAEGRS